MPQHSDEQQLQQVLAQSARWCRHALDDCQPLSGGHSQRVFLLRHGREQFVLKLKTAKTAALKLNLRHEISAQRKAASADLAPQLLYADSNAQYTVSRYIPGATLNTNAADDTELRALAALLSAIHALQPGPAELHLQPCSERYFAQLLQQRTTQQTLLATAQLRMAMQTVFNRISHDPRRCFCHNDLVAANILHSDDGQLRALDWEYGATCSPFFDLATIVNELQLDADAQARLLQYHGANDMAMLRDYCLVQRYITLLWEQLTDNTGAAESNKAAAITAAETTAATDNMMARIAGLQADLERR